MQSRERDKGGASVLANVAKGDINDHRVVLSVHPRHPVQTRTPTQVQTRDQTQNPPGHIPTHQNLRVPSQGHAPVHPIAKGDAEGAFRR